MKKLITLFLSIAVLAASSAVLYSCDEVDVNVSTKDDDEDDKKKDDKTEAKTEAETEAKTDAETEAGTEAGTEAPAAESCKSFVGAGAVVAVLALGVCVVAKKKD